MYICFALFISTLKCNWLTTVNVHNKQMEALQGWRLADCLSSGCVSQVLKGLIGNPGSESSMEEQAGDGADDAPGRGRGGQHSKAGLVESEAMRTYWTHQTWRTAARV